LQALLHYSSLRNDNELNFYLTQNPSSVKVHECCRKQYTCKWKYEQEQHSKAAMGKENVPVKNLCSAVVEPFDWKEHCLLCGESAQFDSKHPNSNKISHVETLEIRASIVQCCAKRCDTWGMEVLQSRLNATIWLPMRPFIMGHVTQHSVQCGPHRQNSPTQLHQVVRSLSQSLKRLKRCVRGLSYVTTSYTH